MIVGIFRLLVGFAATIGMLAMWLVLSAIVMLVVLYICRFIPQAGHLGRHRR